MISPCHLASPRQIIIWQNVFRESIPEPSGTSTIRIAFQLSPSEDSGVLNVRCLSHLEGRSGNGVGPAGDWTGGQAGSSRDSFDGYRSAAHVDGAGIDGGVGRGGATVGGVVDRRPRRGIGQSRRLGRRVGSRG